MWNVRTYCIPTAAIVAREAVLTAVVSAKIRPQVLEPVPDQLAGPFAGQALTPMAAQQPVAERSLPLHWALVGTLRRLQNPPANKHSAD